MKVLLPFLALTSVALAQREARFVRIALPGEHRTLTLAEVEVYSGGKNIARSGKASQINTSNGGKASRALDGNKSPYFGKRGQTHTHGNSDQPWWEVDLGQSASIDQISVWNRSEGSLGDRLDGFSLTLLDTNRKEVFRRDDIVAPESSLDLNFRKKDEISYRSADGKKSKIIEIPSDYRDPAPFAFQKNDTIAIIGNGLAEREQHEGWIETLIQSQLPGHELTFRNLSLTGDTTNRYKRSRGFMPMPDYLQHVGADVVICMFGYNESFKRKPAEYRKDLGRLVQSLRQARPNGKIFPRIILCSPIAHEDLASPHLPDGSENNARLAAITEATKTAADEFGVTFVDLFNPSLARYTREKAPLTINGIHLNQRGNAALGEILASALLNKENLTVSPSLEALRMVVKEKNHFWHYRYRAVDGNDIWGSRSNLRFKDGQSNGEVLVRELSQLDVMTANLDPKIHATASGRECNFPAQEVPESVPVETNLLRPLQPASSSEKQRYLNGEEALEKMTLADGLQASLFADEQRFPELVNPVQMQVDSKGRLWTAVWPTYPMWQPGKPMNDALLIFTDSDQDGKADSVKEFAKVHCPLGFEFWNGGVIVVSQPDLVFLRDTDGDDVADERIILLQGLGSSDTHHAANNLILGPDGAIYWQSGIFLANSFEHPYGPALQTSASGMYRFDPKTFAVSFVASNGPNPHGIAFDDWGYQYATDGTSGRAYQVHLHKKGYRMRKLLEKEVRPVPACEILSSQHFPEAMQGEFLIANTITFLGVKRYQLHRDGYAEKNYKQGETWGTPHGDLVSSTDPNFRPADIIHGADGSLLLADWHNAIIGHMQHNIRDPQRDKKHGRIYRIIAKDRPLEKPARIHGASITELLENLMHPTVGVRHRTRVELGSRKNVVPAVREWLKKFDPKKKEHARAFLEALWVIQAQNVRDNDLLNLVLQSPEPHAVNAAKRVRHDWENAGAVVKIEIQKEEKVKKGGIESDTPDLTTIRINTVVEKMKFDVSELSVKAGKKIRLTVANPDFMPHNFLLVKPGTADAVAAAAISLGADGFKKHFVPESDDVLQASKLLEHKKEQTLEFIAPEAPGDYPFVCTFPGHATLMRGVLKIR